MSLDSKLDKIESKLEKGNIEKALKIFDKYPDDKDRIVKLARIIDRLRRHLGTIHQDDILDKILMEAARDGDMECVVKALIHGASIDAADKWGSALVKSMFNRNYIVSELLIHLGADVNAHDASNETILMSAAVGENIHIVRLLICKGANPFARNKYQRTAKVLAKTQERKLSSFITREIIDLLEAYENRLIGEAKDNSEKKQNDEPCDAKAMGEGEKSPTSQTKNTQGKQAEKTTPKK